MSHIDTLQVYKECLAGGFSESQAQTYVKSLNASFDSVVTKEDLKIAISSLENDLKIFFVYIVGGTLFVAFLIPIIQKYLGI